MTWGKDGLLIPP